MTSNDEQQAQSAEDKQQRLAEIRELVAMAMEGIPEATSDAPITLLEEVIRASHFLLSQLDKSEAKNQRLVKLLKELKLEAYNRHTWYLKVPTYLRERVDKELEPSP